MPGPAWLIFPTYNERENLAPIVHAVIPYLTQATGEDGWRILVVDDGSPDGTGAEADRLATEIAQLHVLHRTEKAGLGPAYVAGFTHALEHGAGYVLEMDADFSHDPVHLPALIKAAQDGADLVLGSRYVLGGGVENWHWLRRAISKGGCLYARMILRVPVRDLTGGFKCFRADTLRTIDYATVRSAGYGFQIELTYRALMRGLRVAEVPITFRERREGQSKMSSRIAFEAMLMVPRIKRKR